MLVISAVRNHGKVIQTQINPTSLFNWLLWLTNKLSHASSKPITRRGFFDRHAFTSAAVLSIKAANPTEFRQLQTVALKYTIFGIAQSWQGSVFSLKFWILGPFFKEVLKRPFNVFKGMLQTISRGIIKPTVSLFVRGQLSRLLVIGQTLFGFFVNLATPSQAPVKDIPDKTGLIGQGLTLFKGKTQLYFDGSGMLIHGTVPQSPCLHSITSSALFQQKAHRYRCQKFLLQLKHAGFLFGIL